MVKTKTLPTKARLLEKLNYNPETGEILWRSTKNHRARVGKPAGHFRQGKLHITVDNFRRSAADIIWCMIHGYWSHGKMQFIDGDKTNIKLENLRPSKNFMKPVRVPKELWARSPVGLPMNLARQRKSVDSIPMGSWEEKNFTCPAASTLTCKQVFMSLDHQQAS